VTMTVTTMTTTMVHSSINSNYGNGLYTTRRKYVRRLFNCDLA